MNLSYLNEQIYKCTSILTQVQEENKYIKYNYEENIVELKNRIRELENQVNDYHIAFQILHKKNKHLEKKLNKLTLKSVVEEVEFIVPKKEKAEIIEVSEVEIEVKENKEICVEKDIVDVQEKELVVKEKDQKEVEEEQEQQVEKEEVEEKVKGQEEEKVEEEEKEVEEVEVEEDQEEVEKVEEVEEVEEKEVENEEEVEEEEDQEEVENEEGDEEEVFLIKIKGVSYYTTDEKNGMIYSVIDNDDIGEEVGQFKNSIPTFLTT